MTADTFDIIATGLTCVLVFILFTYGLISVLAEGVDSKLNLYEGGEHDREEQR